MAKKRKTKARAAKSKPKVKVTKVVLRPDRPLRIEHPKDVVPLVVADPSRGVVEIVPVKKAAVVKQSWWQSLLGH